MAEKLGVSRQTISKWELDETLPDIRQSKRLSNLYHLTLDELIDFDIDLKEIEQIIKNVNEDKQDEIDWSSAWSKKYPILATYLSLDGMDKYVTQVESVCKKVKIEFDLSEFEAFLIVKDMVYRTYRKSRKKIDFYIYPKSMNYGMPFGYTHGSQLRVNFSCAILTTRTFNLGGKSCEHVYIGI